jgi:hypothetical protein
MKVVGAAYLAVAVACSGDSSAPPPSTAVPDRPTVEQALEALDCAPYDRRELRREVDGFSGVRCLMQDTWPTRVWADLPAGHYAYVLGRLAERGSTSHLEPDPCPYYAPNPIVVAGDGWIVISSDIDGANRVREVLGGRLQPGDRPGIPISIPALGCTAGHEVTATR